MKYAVVLLAEGFEEVEALAPVDLLRRAGVQTKILSVTDSCTVQGARGISVLADATLSALNFEQMDLLILPGGYPGYVNLEKSEEVRALVTRAAKENKQIGAICAAPTLLGKWGLLKDKKAACYPQMEADLFCKEVSFDPVVEDGNIITSRGAGTALPFALKLVERLCGEETAKKLAESIVCHE